jgi:hypothetical protein
MLLLLFSHITSESLLVEVKYEVCMIFFSIKYSNCLLVTLHIEVMLLMHTKNVSWDGRSSLEKTTECSLKQLTLQSN